MNNSIVSTSAVNVPIATVAMSSGMTSAQSLPSANPTGSSTNASSGTSSTLPLFPMTPAVVTFLITAGTQTATTHSQANRIPYDYNPAIPPPWGLLSQNTTSNPYFAPNDGTSCLTTPFPSEGNGNNVDNRWRGGYDPGRGEYGAGRTYVPNQEGYHDQHDPGGNRQHRAGRGMNGNAPDGYRHRDRDRNAHRNRPEQPRIPFPKFPEFDGSGS